MCDCFNTVTFQWTVLNYSANFGSAHCWGGAVTCMLISLFIGVFSLGRFLNGTVCIICVYLRIVCTVNRNGRDCQAMEWRYVTTGQATVACCSAHVMEFQVPQCAGNVSQGISNRADIRRINRPTKCSVHKLWVKQLMVGRQDKALCCSRQRMVWFLVNLQLVELILLARCASLFLAK